MGASEVEATLSLPDDVVVGRLLALPEGQWFERKSGRVTPRDLAVPLVAFANAEGGTVVVGLSDGVVDGVSANRLNDLRQAAHDFTQPVVRLRVSERRVASGQTLLTFAVEPGEQVHETSKGDCYLRVGDESRKLNFAQRQELEFDRSPAPFDGTPAPASLVEDLDPAQLGAYQNVLGSASPELMMRARSLLTRDGRVNVAGYLLFAEHPQDAYPNAHVRVLRYMADERGTGAGLNLADDGDVRCEGSIPQQIALASAEIERLIPRRRALAASGRFVSVPIIPRDAWLEGLVNAVVHRSYSIAGDHIRVEIFPSRIDITSPGRFPGLADPTKPLAISRHARNPRIARVCSDLGITQELGEGIRRIFAEMRRQGLTDPLYRQTEAAVRLTLSAADAVPAELRARLGRGVPGTLDALRLAGRPLGTGQVADLAGVSRPTALRHLQMLQEHGLVVWEGESTKDPRATWRVR